MAYHSGSPYIHWVCPERRGQLSIDNIHIPKSLLKEINKTKRIENINIRINTAFEDVITLCGTPHADRPETWINDPIKQAYIQLHRDGHAHSIEYWEGDILKGGLYGLAIGGAFFGESMFSRAPNASKICLVHLAARLWSGGFQLLDTQFVNDHLKQFGVYEITHQTYIERLHQALTIEADFIQEGIPQSVILNRYLAMRAEK